MWSSLQSLPGPIGLSLLRMLRFRIPVLLLMLIFFQTSRCGWISSRFPALLYTKPTLFSRLVLAASPPNSESCRFLDQTLPLTSLSWFFDSPILPSPVLSWCQSHFLNTPCPALRWKYAQTAQIFRCLYKRKSTQDKLKVYRTHGEIPPNRQYRSQMLCFLNIFWRINWLSEWA